MPKKERRAAERRRRSGKLREKRKTWVWLVGEVEVWGDGGMYHGGGGEKERERGKAECFYGAVLP
jgi:hypothetical protein